MATKLDKSLKREIDIDGKPYMLTIDPAGMKLVPKGKRNGLELSWQALVGGDAALATALNASLQSKDQETDNRHALEHMAKTCGRRKAA
jgi:hypothetical protein